MRDYQFGERLTTLRMGYPISILPVDASGIVSCDDLSTAVYDHTVLVSIMLANNEIGTIEPIRQLEDGVVCSDISQTKQPAVEHDSFEQ